MKKMRKVLAMALVGTMVVGAFAGCSKSNASGGSDVFKIGGIGPVTGDAAVYGKAVQTGAQIAVDEINAAGGINGKKIEFKFEDDKADPETSVNAYNTLKDWGMQILMGTVTSGAGVEVAAQTSTDNMFQLTPSASSADVISGGNGNVFQVCFTDPNQGIASAQYIGENKLAKKVGIIYDSSDVYSTGIYDKFVEEAKKQGFEVVATQAFTSSSKTDFSVQVQACKDKGAELVFLPIYYKEASLILTEANKQNYKPTFFGCDGLDGILSVENFDVKLAEGTMLLTPFSADATDKKTTAFVKAYKDKSGEVPNQFAADAYDAIYVIKAAIEKAEVTPDKSVSDICDGLKDAMVNVKVDGLTGSGMTWKSTGEVNKAPMAVVIKNGAYALAK